MMQLTTKTTLARLGALALTAALASLAVVLGTAAAFDQVNEKPAPLGLIGMTQEQTLRLSVAYVSGFDPQPDPPRYLLKVGFARGDGSVIGNPHIFELRPGTARSFDLAASAIGNPNIRVYVRPIVTVQAAQKDDCPAVVTGELLDREGLNGIIVYDSVAFSDPWLAT
jgi:hypothetical protein